MNMAPIQNSQPHADLAAAHNDVIDLRDYVYIVRAYLPAIIGFSFVVSVIGILLILSMTPIYRGTTTLLIEANEQKVIKIDEVYSLGTGKMEYYFTQFEILKSRDLARIVVTRNRAEYEKVMLSDDKGSLGLIKSLLKSQARNQTQDSIEPLVDNFMANLAIVPVRSTQLVNISFDSPSAEFSAKMANELALAYIENNLDARLAMTQQAATWLASRIDGLKTRLEESEQKLQRYREQEDLVDIEGIMTLASKQLEDITVKLAEYSQRRVEAENIVKQVERLPNQSVKELSSLPAVLNYTLIQNLKHAEGVAEQRYTELSKRYGPQHPKMIAAKSDLDVARQNTATQIMQVVGGIKKEYEIAKSTEESLHKEMEMLKARVQELNRKQYHFDELSREVAVNKQLYETFFSRVKETSEAGELQAANARIIDPAMVPTRPVKPQVFLLSVITVAASLFFAAILALLKEAYDSTIRFRDDVVFKLHTQLLGIVPWIKDFDKTGEHAALTYSKNQLGSFSEAIRTIRTGVVLSALDNPHKIILVTSSIPGEGKTTCSSNLASAFGQIGKTLLIDADMRRPMVAKSFGISGTSPGLSNLVAETSEHKDCIHTVAEAGIDVLPAGTIPPNPLELLSSKRFAAMLANLEKQYDRIIIDTAPCEVVSDALVLATYASAIVYVVRADSTNSKIVKSGINRLKQAGTPITGVILNRVNVDKRAGYGYSYGYGYGYGRHYGGYYDYYGYSSSKKNQEK